MFNEIKNKIKNKKLIIFGEIHGTKEIPEMISQFFSEIAKEEDFDVCFEIPVEFQNQIDDFMREGNTKILEEIPFFSKENHSDSRNNPEYISLIKRIYKINSQNERDIKIFFMDPPANNQKEKEKGLANNIIELNQNKKTFVILGDIHASKKEIKFLGEKIIPAGLLVFNKLGEKMLNVRIAPKNKELSKEEKLFNKGFDFVIKV